jgi:PhoH-like ATPase
MTKNNSDKVADKRLFVLDTNVLLHDPTALFRFHEHDIFLPMAVIEELDRSKKGSSEVSRNARQASRFLNDIMQDAQVEDIMVGLAIPSVVKTEKSPQGRLFFQVQASEQRQGLADDQIIAVAKGLLAHPINTESYQIVLVSKDINLRIKAKIEGLNSEDYINDKVLEDGEFLDSGIWFGSENPWQGHQVAAWNDAGHTFLSVEGAHVAGWFPNQLIQLKEDKSGYFVKQIADGKALLQKCTDYSTKQVWGVQAKNNEQSFAMNMLLDPSIDLVTLLGAAGTGKTLLTLAAGLSQVLDTPIYNEIIMTRITVPVGDDIGFLPGSEEEKMAPWMGALMDNLEVLSGSESATERQSAWKKAATNDLIGKRIKIHSLNFMRGRTFQKKFLIIDEAQNLTSKQMTTLITRAGPGTKIVCLGNVAQIDTPYLTETTSGLTYVVDRFRQWPHAAHITLQRSERSRLAEFASEAL